MLHLRYGLYLPRDASASGTPFQLLTPSHPTARVLYIQGTRSPRLGGKAVRKPGHNMIIGAKRIPGGQMGTCPGEANSVVAGVRSPPLRRKLA